MGVVNNLALQLIHYCANLNSMLISWK